MSTVQIIIYLISIGATLVLGTFVFTNNVKSKINKTFFIFTLTLVAWIFSLFLFYIIESPGWVQWMGRLNFATVPFMLYYLLKFSFIFPREFFSVPRGLKIGLTVWFFSFAAITLLTPLVGKEEIITGVAERETIYGSLYLLYVAQFIIVSVLATSIIIYKLRKTKEKMEKYQLGYVASGLGLALGVGMVTNIIFPLFGIFQAQHYGSLATLIFTGFFAYAIVKHFLFDLKVIATEIFALVMVSFLFVNLFSYQTPAQLVLNIVIFLGAIIFGIFLIRSVWKEVRTRSEMQKLAHRLKKAYKELERLDKAKSEFISIASHQLRTPLTAIKGYISMILEGIYGQMSEKVKKPMENVYKSNERLIKLINDLLSVSRIESGKLEMDFQMVLPSEIITSCVEELKIQAKNKKIGLKWEEPPRQEALPRISIDRDKMRQVILNIIDNAIKYTERGEVRIKCQIMGGKYRIVIADTGAGMTKEEASYLFESFSRGKAGTELCAEGAGLGLYIAKKFVEMHGGKIWATSLGKGKGSTLYIELPIK